MRLLPFLLLILVQLYAALPAYAQQSAQVKVGSAGLFVVTASEGDSAADRAEKINDRIDKILQNKSMDPSKIDAHYLPDGTTPQITLADFPIMTITKSDAEAYGTQQSDLAVKWSRQLRSRIKQLQPLYKEAAPAGKGELKVLSEHKVLLLVVQVAVLLLVAIALGEIMARFGQPPVIGQMMAGIVLGQSVLGNLFPGLTQLVFPVEETQSYLLEVVSWLGVIFLLMLTGMETDLGLIRRQGKPAIGAAVGGIVAPFLFGVAAGYIIPESLILHPDRRFVVAMFLGTVLSVSSVPVIAKILMDMGLMRRNVGQVILAGALAHDIAGCLILAVVAALASNRGDQAALLIAPVGTIVFVAVAFLGRKWFYALLRWVNDKVTVEQAMLSTIAICLLFSAATTQFIGVHVVLGAFAVGVLLAQSPLISEKVIHPLEAVTLAIFAPIFFASACLHVNLAGIFMKPDLLLVTLVFIAISCVSKIAGCYFGGMGAGLGKYEALGVGLGTNARGAMGLIVGILGFSLGIITLDLFSIIVVMSLVTTAMAPPLLNWCLKKIAITEEEKLRLEKEEKQEESFINEINRILIPVVDGSRIGLTAPLLNAISEHHGIEATAVHVLTNGASGDKLGSMFKTVKSAVHESEKLILVTRTVKDEDTADGLLKEAGLNYDLILLGCDKAEHKGTIFGHVVDEMGKRSPCHLMVVQGPDTIADWKPHNILITTTGEPITNRAAEFAIVLSKKSGAKLTAVSVAEELPDMPDVHLTIVQNLASDYTKAIEKMAEAFEVDMDEVVCTGLDAGPEIVRIAKDKQVDLIVLGGNVRQTPSLFYGPTISYVLMHSDCAVAVLS